MTTLLFLVLLAVLIGCEEYPDPAVIEDQKAALKDMNKAIRFYHDSNGKYPENISEIEKLMRSPIEHDVYWYDPQDGKVKLKRR